MSSLVSFAFDQVRTYTGAIAWNPLVRASRKLILSLFSQIKVGRLIVVEKDGTHTVCGQNVEDTSTPLARMRVMRDAFWLRLALFADMVRNVVPLSP